MNPNWHTSKRFLPVLSALILLGMLTSAGFVAPRLPALDPEPTPEPDQPLPIPQDEKQDEDNSSACPADSRAARLSLDGVKLLLCAPFDLRFENLPRPDDFVQVASSAPVSGSPTLSLLATPYGVRPPGEDLPAAEKGIADTYRITLASFRRSQGALLVENIPLSLFGQQVNGSVSLVSISGRPTLIAEWVAEAGGRVWLLRLIRENPTKIGGAAITAFTEAFLPAFSLSAADLSIPSTSRAARESSLPPSFVVSPKAADLPFPSWWSGTCNLNNHPGAFPLSASYRGVIPCGPLNSEVPVNFGVGVTQLEWQCPEFSKRYLYLAFGIPPYSASGKDVVWNYTGTRLVKIINGTVGQAPQPGDVLSYGSHTTYGHTSVISASGVDSAGNGTVTVVEQNYNLSGTRTHQVVNWVVQDSMIASGWLHDPLVDPAPDPDIPPGYTFCSPEGGNCEFKYCADVSFGAAGQFRYISNQYESVSCTAAAFGGDPLPGVTKTCAYRRVECGFCPPAIGEVRLYDGTYCAGPSTSFNGDGLWNLALFFNDRAESIAIPSGWSARLYKDADESGSSKCFGASDPDFGNDLFSDGTPLANQVTWMRVFYNTNCGKTDSATVITTDTPDPSVAGQPYPVGVRVTGAAEQPTGIVRVRDGSGASCTAILSGSTGACALTSTSPGDKTLTATYLGDGLHRYSTTTAPHTVLRRTVSAILSDLPDPSLVNQNYRVTLRVTGANGVPTGVVNVSDGGGASCQAVLVNGTGSCLLASTSIGSKTLTAVYSGDTLYGASQTTAAHAVRYYSATSILSDLPDPSRVNRAYTVRVRVNGAYGTPTGRVTVSDGTGASCAAALSNGVASCALVSRTTGTKTLTAVYAGSARYRASRATATHKVIN